MRPVKIFSDSTCDLSPELIQRHNIGIVPLYVNFDKLSFKDGVDLDSTGLIRKVKETGKLPKTSAPTAADFTAEFKKYLDQDMDILHISISSKISASYQNACAAAQELPEGRVKIVDSLNLSSGIGILALTAAECIESGMSLAETVQTVQSAVPRVRTAFIIDTVEYLHKGGRCSGLQFLLSSLLEIHPIIAVNEGAMHVAAKVRGNRAVTLRGLMKHALAQPGSIEPKHVFVTHCKSDEDAPAIKQQLLEMNRFKNIWITEASCVISSHCGPKTIGIIYLEK